jgi:hypothetical protein
MLRDAGNNVDGNNLIVERSSMNLNEENEDLKEDKGNF